MSVTARQKPLKVQLKKTLRAMGHDLFADKINAVLVQKVTGGDRTMRVFASDLSFGAPTKEYVVPRNMRDAALMLLVMM